MYYLEKHWRKFGGPMAYGKTEKVLQIDVHAGFVFI